jgi:hypothetical protein
MRNHWNGCGLILHELCHLIHQQVLGLDCERVNALYKRACQSGRYNRVLRRDWAGKEDGDTDLAYCMIDHKEFFAEISVTYWSKGYGELDEASCDSMEECSPAITEPNVLARLGHVTRINGSKKELHISCGTSFAWVCALIKSILPLRRHLPHCNKFYPFTSGQLEHYDPMLLADIKNIWDDISMWEDSEHKNEHCSGCWIPPWTKKKGKLGLHEDSAKALDPPNIISDTVEL